MARPTVSAFLFCRGSTAASRVKTSITTRPYFVFPRVFWLKSMRSACSRSFGPSASGGGRGACTCRPTLAFSASKAMACVTSPCESVQLPRVPHVEVVGQVPQRLHLKNSIVGTHLLVAQKRGYSRFRGCEEA